MCNWIRSDQIVEYGESVSRPLTCTSKGLDCMHPWMRPMQCSRALQPNVYCRKCGQQFRIAARGSRTPRRQAAAIRKGREVYDSQIAVMQPVHDTAKKKLHQYLKPQIIH